MFEAIKLFNFHHFPSLIKKNYHNTRHKIPHSTDIPELGPSDWVITAPMHLCCCAIQCGRGIGATRQLVHRLATSGQLFHSESYRHSFSHICRQTQIQHRQEDNHHPFLTEEHVEHAVSLSVQFLSIIAVYRQLADVLGIFMGDSIGVSIGFWPLSSPICTAVAAHYCYSVCTPHFPAQQVVA